MKLRRFLEVNFDVVQNLCRGDEVVMICPEPVCNDSSGKRSVNVKSNVTSCWKCNIGGNVFKWLNKHGLDTSELDDIPLDGELDNDMEEVKRVHAMPFLEVDLPDGFELVADHPKTYYYKAIARMAKRKHLDIEDLIRASVGFTRGKTRDSAKWEAFAIFPVFEWGKVVYYQGRTYIDIKDQTTKRFPNKEECPYSSRYWLYNIDKARKATEDKPVRIILVESILNVLSLEKELRRRKIRGFVPIALFKHALSKEQGVKLRALRHVEEICMMFDSDATDDAWKLTEKLAHFPVVTAVNMPHKVDANDNAELAVDLLLKRADAKRADATLLRDELCL